MDFRELFEQELPTIRAVAEWRTLIFFECEETAARIYLDHLAQELGQADWDNADSESVYQMLSVLADNLGIEG